MKRKLLLLSAVMSIGFHGCAGGSKSPSAQPIATPNAYSISGKITTPLGPARDARVVLEAFTDEACARLSEKQNGSKEENKKLAECVRDLPEIKSNENGEYKLADVKPGWYSLIMGWQAPVKSNLEDGADLTGPYRTYYRRVKNEAEKFGVVAVGLPFQFSGTSDVTKDLIYPKDREPYKSAK